jgi:hypothetical protein
MDNRAGFNIIEKCKIRWQKMVTAHSKAWRLQD